MADEPRWGPATTYRSSPHLRKGAGTPRSRTATQDHGSADGYGPAQPDDGYEDDGYDRQGRRGAFTGLDRAPRPPRARTGGAAAAGSASRPAGAGGSRADRQGRRPLASDGDDGDGPQDYDDGGRSPRRRGLGRFVVLLLILAVVAYPVLLGWTGYTSIGRTGALPASTLPDTPGRTILLVGTDSRADLTRDQQVQLSTGGDAGGDRTDTIMLLHRPANGGKVVLLSIPRDSYVAIPGHGKSKINAAYSWGGASLLAQTVEQATGLRVDGYAETGLGGFAGLVDAVGGVTQCPTAAIKDVKAGLDIAAGCQTMNGATALGYARTRDYDANGDLGRAQRQRALIAAIAKKAASPAVLANPFTAFPLAKAGGAALSVDDSFGPGDLVSLVQAMRSVAGGDAVSLNVPVRTANLRTSSGVAIAWDEAQSKAVFDAIRTDDTSSLEAIAATEPAVKAAAS